mgnify:CR=1 FL=1|jgi:hypothetical protein
MGNLKDIQDITGLTSEAIRDLLAARNIKKFGLEKQNLLTQ